MVGRILTLPSEHSFLLFGARGTGKSSLLRERFRHEAPGEVLSFDLLDPDMEDRFLRDPGSLEREVAAAGPALRWVVLDEVQKVPRLLDVAHRLIELRGLRFALTGSSARKLKRGGANMLAGRASVLALHPLLEEELGGLFDLNQSLCTGTLPGIWFEPDPVERERRVRAYALTYMKEEVQAEQLVRRLEPFRRFLEIAAQQSGKKLSYESIAREVGVADGNTVLAWFQILEDTLLGFFLPAFHRSVRKSQRASPKFFLFDHGVKRALDRTLDVPLHPGTSAFGDAFEHLVITEFHRRNELFERDFALSYLETRDGGEVDLILSKPSALHFIEIKSSDRVDPVRAARFARLVASVPDAQGLWLSRDPIAQDIDGVRCRFWREGLRSVVGPRR